MSSSSPRSLPTSVPDLSLSFSAFFSFAVYTLWRIEYGGDGGERHMRRVNGKEAKDGDESDDETDT